ncbi:MAG: hypothetical protein V4478_03215 [Patescibacteria group bacterium]
MRKKADIQLDLDQTIRERDQAIKALGDSQKLLEQCKGDVISFRNHLEFIGNMAFGPNWIQEHSIFELSEKVREIIFHHNRLEGGRDEMVRLFKQYHPTENLAAKKKPHAKP